MLASFTQVAGGELKTQGELSAVVSGEVSLTSSKALEERFEEQSVTMRITKESLGDVQVCRL